MIGFNFDSVLYNAVSPVYYSTCLLRRSIRPILVASIKIIFNLQVIAEINIYLVAVKLAFINFSLYDNIADNRIAGFITFNICRQKLNMNGIIITYSERAYLGCTIILYTLPPVKSTFLNASGS